MNDTALQTHGSKFEPWRSEAELSVTEAPHNIDNIESLRMSGEETFFKLEGQSGVRTRDLQFSKQAPSTTASGPRPLAKTRVR